MTGKWVILRPAPHVSARLTPDVIPPLAPHVIRPLAPHVIPRLVRGTCRGTPLIRVPRTSRAMTWRGHQSYGPAA